MGKRNRKANQTNTDIAATLSAITPETVNHAVLYPVPGTCYKFTESSVDANHLKEFIHFSTKNVSKMQPKVIWGLVWEMESFKCGGARQCTHNHPNAEDNATDPVSSTNGVPCTYAVNRKKKTKQCPEHGTDLVDITDCPTRTYYGRCNETNESILFSVNDHNHLNPKPWKISGEDQNAVRNEFREDINQTPKDVLKGGKSGVLPFATNTLFINIDTIANIKKKVKQEKTYDMASGDRQMLLAYEIEERYMKKLSMQKLSDFLPEGVTDVKELIQPFVRDLQVTPSRMTLLTQSPMQSKLAMLSDTLVIDLKHKSKKGPLYNLIGMSTFLEKYDCAFQISQTYTLRDGSEDYYHAFYKVFEAFNVDAGKDRMAEYLGQGSTIEELEDPNYHGPSDGKIYLTCVLADFSLTQRNAFLRAVRDHYGEEVSKTVDDKLSGCLVHFERCNLRVVKGRGLSEEDQKTIRRFILQVHNAKSVSEVEQILRAMLLIDKNLASYVNWWCGENPLKMLYQSVVLKRNGKRSDTNIQEVLHNNVGCCNGDFISELENNTKEMVVAVFRILAVDKGYSTTYRDRSAETRAKNNKKRSGKNLDDNQQSDRDMFDERPADTIARGLAPPEDINVSIGPRLIQELNNNRVRQKVVLAREKEDDMHSDEELESSDEEIEDGVAEPAELTCQVKEFATVLVATLTVHDLEVFYGDQTVKRGKEYQIDGKIIKLDGKKVKNGFCLSGVCLGTDAEYKVSTWFQGGKLRSMCSCPQAVACKHSVAQLLHSVGGIASLKLEQAVDSSEESDSEVSCSATLNVKKNKVLISAKKRKAPAPNESRPKKKARQDPPKISASRQFAILAASAATNASTGRSTRSRMSY